MTNSNFDYMILEAIQNAIKTVKASPLNLGGVTSISGGGGGPPGGFNGVLPQKRVGYDTGEIGTLFTPTSGESLYDNLNHIRYRLNQLEAISGGGAITFLELTDTPDDYTGNAGKAVIVNPTEDALIFATISGGTGSGGASSFLDLTDTPNSYVGQVGKYVVVASGEASLEFISLSGAGISRYGSTTDGHIAIWNGNDTDSIRDGGIVPSGTLTDGWISDTNTWSYSSADAPTFVISVNADMTNVLSAGMRIKLTQTTAKYFIVTAIGSFSGGVTLITVYGGTDYTLANAAIASPYYSTTKSPLGFPLDPAKWTQSSTDSTLLTLASGTPTANTWYNSISLSIPIGQWVVFYEVVSQMGKNNATQDMKNTLSTANNSESSTYNTTYQYINAVNGFIDTHRKMINLTLASKTTYYLNHLSTQTGITTFNIRGDICPTQISAICAYL